MNTLLEQLQFEIDSSRGQEATDLTSRGIDQLLSNWNVLMLPGWNGSGPAHWQSIWEQKYPSLRRIEQSDWEQPTCQEWIQRIDADVRSARGRVILVAHSLACIAVALWAREYPESAKYVEAALLVAPADVSDPQRAPASLWCFAPIPRQTLPFRSMVIGSENDPYMSITTARELAGAWGSQFINAGAAGHINCASGNGPWPEGEQYLAQLVIGSDLSAASPC